LTDFSRTASKTCILCSDDEDEEEQKIKEIMDSVASIKGYGIKPNKNS